LTSYLNTSEGVQTEKSNLNNTRPKPERVPRNLPYNALSYVWGNALDRVTIQVDGKDFSITKNLWIFLDHHRKTFLRKKRLRALFWIDAICIDQENIGERSRQVEFMADIYKEAQIVLVWLGEGNSDSCVAFEAIKESWGQEKVFSETERKALTSTFNGGYWDRLWIVQEICHARRIILRCDTVEINWASFISQSHFSELLRAPFWIESFRLFRPFKPFKPYRTELSRERGEKVLHAFGNKECSDPRDAVYALRSLAPSLMSVVPDYSLSTVQVFTAAMRAAASNSKSLVLLDQVMYKKPIVGRLPVIEGLPSWVPDWGMTFISERRLPEIRFPNAGGVQLKQEELLCHENPQVLLLKGITVDIVLHATEPYVWEGEQSRDPEKAVHQLHCWLPKCDMTLNSNACDLHINDTGLVHLTFGGLLDEFSRRLGCEIPEPEFLRRKFANKVESLSRLMGTAIVITRSGYRGFVFGEPKLNDLLFVAYGAKYPYILRRTGANKESYSFIGNAVIERLMDGEALELSQKGDLTEHTASYS
jgi:hypothetical protein